MIWDMLAFAEKVNLRLLNSSTWDSTTEHEWKVPAGKRWFIYGGMVNRSDSATLIIEYRDTGDNLMMRLVSESAATGPFSWPESSYKVWTGLPLILDPGEHIRFTFGVAQGAAAYITGVALEANV
ncbi:unnamed protein product [marine sediment metagenome]|uniref:Uncharacterized protein n=1 Tax=marine sediment metagenome TaxID=412755 RepID=X1JF34_9ZZZZ